MAQIPAPDDVTKVLKDALYVTVGLGVIAFQKAQVARRDVEEQLGDRFDGLRQQVDRLQADEVLDEVRSKVEQVAGDLEDRIQAVEGRLEAIEDQVEDYVEQLEEKLPEQAAELVKQTREALKAARTQAQEAAREARGQVRSLVTRAA